MQHQYFLKNYCLLCADRDGNFPVDCQPDGFPENCAGQFKAYFEHFFARKMIAKSRICC